MTPLMTRRQFRRQRKTLKLLAIALIPTVIYFGFLAVQNHQARIFASALSYTEAEMAKPNWQKPSPEQPATN